MPDYLIVHYDLPEGETVFPATRADLGELVTDGGDVATGADARAAIGAWFNSLSERARQAVAGRGKQRFLVIELGEIVGLETNARAPTSTTKQTYPA